MNCEVFKTINHNPGYEISNMGRVRNKTTQAILTPTVHERKGVKNPTTYLRIELKNPRKKYLVHRLVAQAFIENPDNLPQVNHKDKDGCNNTTENLEWCDAVYNCTHAQGKPVVQSDPDTGEVVGGYVSASSAARATDSDVRLISAVCLGKRKSHNNYKWSYA